LTVKEIKDLSIQLDDSNPDTPRIVNPLNGHGQRADYTHVLLFALLKKIEALTEALTGTLVEGTLESTDDDQAPEPAPAPTLTAGEDDPTVIEPALDPKPNRRSSRSKKAGVDGELD
jgi:hypothetical protein